VSQIKAAVLDGVDPVAAFAGRTLTGGRLNVLSSLRQVADVTITPAPPAPPAPAPAAEADDAPAPPRPGKAFVADTAPPRLSVRVARRVRIGRLRGRGLPVRVRCSEACSARLRLSGTGARVRSGTLDAGASRRFVLRLGRAAFARLSAAGTRRAKLVVRATDRWGNRRTLTVRILLRG
jgi:hypothetical protein